MTKRNGVILVIFISALLLIVCAMPSAAAEKIVWRGQSSYSAGLPQLYSPAAHFAKEVEKLTDGRLVIKMSPGGSIVPALKVFDAVSAGTLDIGCTWAGWWIGKFPAAVLFANSYPNGMQTQEMLGWIYTGGVGCTMVIMCAPGPYARAGIVSIVTSLEVRGKDFQFLRNGFL